MRRTDEEFKAEVFRRCEAFRSRKKARVKKAALLCLPVLLCGGLWIMVSSGIMEEAATQTACDNAASVECAEMPAAAEPEEMEMAPASDGEFGAASGTAGLADQQMPADFAIRFTWSIAAENIYDTYAGQLQKDLVLDGVATADFEPDEAVLEQIWQQICLLDIRSIDREMTSAVLTTTDQAIACEPLTVYKIQFTANGEVYTVKGDETASFYPEDGDAQHFMEFVKFMCGIMQDTPEYQQLPEANGGYD